MSLAHKGIPSPMKGKIRGPNKKQSSLKGRPSPLKGITRDKPSPFKGILRGPNKKITTHKGRPWSDARRNAQINKEKSICS
jgi:hypothetical protein